MFTLPDFLYIFLFILVLIGLTFVFISLLFYTCISLLGVRKPQRNYVLVPDAKKFIFIVPAHNEESVIGKTLESILALNYNKSLFNVTVIVDNCTDNTENIVKTYPVEYLVTTSGEDEPRGKPYAIKKYMNTLTWTNYDYVVFLDADNIVNSNYLKEINSQVITYPSLQVIQGYLGIKNVSTSFVASGYAASYFITNRMLQYAKSLVGINAAIGGTGFALNTEYLHKYGWNPRSYTEDFELQVELILHHEDSSWNHFAEIYDEKPNSLYASHMQRLRWAQGHWFVALSKTAAQVIAILEAKSLKRLLNTFEMLLYSFSMLRSVLLSFIVLLIIIDFRFLRLLPLLNSLMVLWVVLGIIHYCIIPTIGLLTEARAYFSLQPTKFKQLCFFCRLFIARFYNAITYAIVQIQGFCTCWRPQTNWNKTAHSESSEVLDQILDKKDWT